MKKSKMMPETSGKIEPIGGMIDNSNDPNREPMPHEVSGAIDDIMRAEAHKANPIMMKHVHEATGKKIMDLKSLRALAGKKAMEGK